MQLDAPTLAQSPFPSAFSMNRRSLLRSGMRTAAWLTAGSALARAELVPSSVSAAPAATTATTDDGTAAGLLDAFVSLYLAEMNCPGLTLALTGRERTIRTQGYGFSDPTAQVPVTPDLLFEIGSITKSFVAIALLQLREEGKLDLDRPVLEYLPWLPIETGHGPITAHHLLTHTSGLPNRLNLFPSDPHARLIQSSKPGEHFHYCNAGFEALGYLIEKLDGKPWHASIRKRIFEPLGMRDSFAVITNDTLHRRARSWVSRYDDQAQGRHAALSPAGAFMFADAAGSIESTPGDMARYMRMLIGRGQGPSGRILSEESFRLLSKPVIESKELSPTAFYGYGIAIDHLDGHTVLRHTGGMASFISSIVVDLDAGFGAFASVNVAHGFRPNPVTIYAIKLLNAEAEKKPLPPRPMLPDPNFVAEAGAYAKTYTSPDGRTIEAVADGTRLFLRIHGETVPLEMVEPDVFISTARPYAKFPFVFTRAGGSPAAANPVPSPKDSTAGSKENASPRPFAELVWGPDWFASSDYQGAREDRPAPDLAGFPGHYRAESPWAGSLRVVVRRGRLWLDGTTPLSPIGPGLFRAGTEAWSPETAAFHYFVDGRPQLLKLSGFDFWRIEAE
jgi:D-alanyl-D-alanine carboxypeptidase